MAIKARLSTDEYAALDPAIKAHYKQGADATTYVLDSPDADEVFSAPLKKALQSERDEQKKLTQQMAALREAADRVKDIDVEEYRRIKAEQEKLAEKKLIDAGEVEKLVAKRLEAAQKDHGTQMTAAQAQIKAEQDKNLSLSALLETELIGNRIRAAATQRGVRDEAVADVLNRGRAIWKLEEGKPVPYKDGQIYYGKTATQPISMDEWLESLVTDAPHLFHPNNGSGARPGQAGRPVGNVLTLTRDQARDPRQYRAAQEQAQKQGLEIQIAAQ